MPRSRELSAEPNDARPADRHGFAAPVLIIVIFTRDRDPARPFPIPASQNGGWRSLGVEIQCDQAVGRGVEKERHERQVGGVGMGERDVVGRRW